MGVDISTALQGAATSPAPDVSPNEYVRKLMAEHPSEVLPFPRNGADGKPLFEYRMCVLSQRELDGCLIDAEKYTAAQFKNHKSPNNEDLGAVRGEAWTEVYNNAKIVEVLLRACRQTEVRTNAAGKTYYDALFIGGEQIRKLLTTDELAALFNAYQNTQFRYGPLWRMLDGDEVDAIVDMIDAGADHYPLASLGQDQMMLLIGSLAARLRTYRTGDGLSGSGSEKPTSESLENQDDSEAQD